MKDAFLPATRRPVLMEDILESFRLNLYPGNPVSKRPRDREPSAEITWAVPRQGVAVGDTAGTVMGRKHYVHFNGLKLPAIFIAYVLHHGEMPPPRSLVAPDDGDWRNIHPDNFALQTRKERPQNIPG